MGAFALALAGELLSRYLFFVSHHFRNLNDTRALVARAGKGVRAVVIGGGLLGLEAARGLQLRGCDVTVMHLVDSLMNMQLDGTGGLYLQRKMEQMGVRVLTQRSTKRLLGNGHVEGVRFADGENCKPIWWWSPRASAPMWNWGEKPGLR